MNIGIVRLYCGQSGKFGFYNMQEVGLAKSLVKYGINVYIFLPSSEINKIYENEVGQGIKIVNVPAKKILNHGFYNCMVLLDYNVNTVLLESDNQLYAPHVMEFCKKNSIKCFNYVGALYTDSKSIFKRLITKPISKRNIKYFRRYPTFVKTPYVQEQLKAKGVESKVIPVGLDIDIIPSIKESKEELRKSMGFPVDKKIIIFVGRLEEYKKPINAVELIKNLNDGYILIIIGDGSLKEDLITKMKDYGVESRVKYIERIPNKEIHRYYKMSDIFVNFNENEIFGMSILEAMYQGCIVIGKHAPGPDFIIEDGVTGFQCNDLEGMCLALKKVDDEMGVQSKKRILNSFNWDIISEKILDNLKV